MPARPSISSPAPMSAGGFSIYARALGKYLPRYIPGNPTVVVKNMPGAGGATASAWLYRIAPKDGTAIASVSPNAILGKLLDDSQTQYDPTKFQYLAGAERGTRLCMTFQHSKVKTLRGCARAEGGDRRDLGREPDARIRGDAQARGRRKVRDRERLQGAARPVHRHGARRDRRRLRARLVRAQVAAAGLAARRASSIFWCRARSIPIRNWPRSACPTPWTLHRATMSIAEQSS